MSIFIHRLNLLLEEHQGSNPAEEAMDIIKKLDNIKQQMLELQNQLMTIKKKIIGKSATRIHQERPDLNIDVNNDECKIGNENCLTLKPNLLDQTWIIKGKPTTGINNINELLKTITSFFGDITEENGKIYINGQKSNMLLLTEWANNKTINSRKNRKTL